MIWFATVGMLLIAAFGLVVLVGPPYLPTFRQQAEAALDMLDLKSGQTLLELGSGDGRIMLAAARRGLHVVGIELNPLLVVISFFVTLRYRRNVRIIWGSYWHVAWPSADGIFTFMLPKYMATLDERIIRWHQKPVCLASYAFVVPGKQPIREHAGIFLYEYR